MGQEFFSCLIARAGIAGEFEALTETEIAAAPGAAYSPPEIGNFRIVASRIIQLLSESPIYIESQQTSAATIRVPSGVIATNDAGDGRIYFIKNSDTAVGLLAIEKSDGTLLKSINPKDTVVLLHGDNDAWNVSDPISGTDGFGSTFRYTHDGGIPDAGTRFLRTGQNIASSSAGDRLIKDLHAIGMSIRTNKVDTARSYDVELLSDPSGTPIVLATLALPIGSQSEGRNDLNIFVSAPTEIGVRMIRTSGTGKSKFKRINVNVQFG